MSRLEVELVPLLSDNYAFLVRDPATGTLAAVDPGEAAPFVSALAGRKLDQILITHHHGDHIGGVDALRRATGAKVHGNAADAAALPPLDSPFAAGDRIAIGACEGTVIDTPGHADGHVALAFDGHVFCGDVLFVLGCGRLVEGTAAQLWSSLQKLAALPDDTKVWCGHEYTLSNARFAVTVEPENAALRARATEIERLRADKIPTVPSTIGLEKATNPFLRAGSVERFAAIRKAKDTF